MSEGINQEDIINEKSLDFISTDPRRPVKLRYGEGKSSLAPLSIISLFTKVANNSQEKNALIYKREKKGPWVNMNYREYLQTTIIYAKIFIKLGLEPHNSVGIIGFNSPEWFISNMAAIFAGGLAVGIYTTNSPEACLYVANHSNCNIIVVENDIQLQKFLKVRDKLNQVKAFIQYRGKPSISDPQIFSWDDLVNFEITEEEDKEFNRRQKTIKPNNCSTIIYTSGTTGDPKGAMLSHDNLTWSSQRMVEHGKITSDDVFITYLPLSHIAAQIMDIYTCLSAGASVYFAQPNALKGGLANTLQEVKPTLFLGVPRVWEKMQEGIEMAAKKSFMKKLLIGWSRKVSKSNKGCSYKMANNLIYSKIKKKLGFDRCRYFLSGAAPIRKETIHFFHELDILLIEGYGMSECTGVHSLAKNESFRMGSVGNAFEGVKNHIIPQSDGGEGEGEICMEGRHVFMGYMSDEGKTREVIDDQGRLHSGDLGMEDKDKFIFITGRIKELIITSGGENVAPVPIEDRVKETLPCVSNCMLVGDKRKFLSLLITFKTNINLETLEPTENFSEVSLSWCKAIGSKSTKVEEVINKIDSLVTKAIDEGLALVNEQAISNAQKIQKWIILPVDFSIPGGELGPTLKLKRGYVAKKYKNEIEGIYADL